MVTFFTNSACFYFPFDTRFAIYSSAQLDVSIRDSNGIAWHSGQKLAGRLRAINRLDVNAPDMYISVMAFVTYILLIGTVMGIENR
jgi:hypothetical protein